MNKEVIDNILKSHFKLDDDFELKRDIHLQDELGADMMDRLDLAIQFEEAFGCAILDEVCQSWVCVGNIYRYFGITFEGNKDE